MKCFVHSFALGCLTLCFSATFTASGGTITWISSTESQPWQTMPALSVETPKSNQVPEVRVVTTKTFQTIDGFGGCFNELGWLALGKVSEANRKQALSALFGDEGCAFTLGRIPIGASDFATNGYSLDDTPSDLALTNFSITRDERLLLPYIKAAVAVRPALKCWGSPWSPPAWMKDNNHYSRGSIKWEPAILNAYAHYFTRWVEAYRSAGINIYALTPQNEPNILNVYPTCLWTGPQLREFIADYLGPTLHDRKANVELWLGLNGDPINSGDNINDRLITVLEDPKASAFIAGVGFQYDSRNQIGAARELYPEKKLMQSETECNSGNNSWSDALKLYGLMRRYLDNGASSYFMWNMVLDETGLGSWNWRQNAMITVNHQTGQVTYNGEFYVMRHFSQFVKPGAKRVLTTGIWGDKIAFVNPDGSTVLIMGNSDKRAYEVILTASGFSADVGIKATLPAKSVNTFVIPPPPASAKLPLTAAKKF